MNNYLLTYDYLHTVDDGNFIATSYAWFETEEEMMEFITEKKKHDSCFSVNEAIEILDSKKIEV